MNKCTQWSNRQRWTEINLLYTRNFLTFLRNVDVYRLHFIDEVHVNKSNRQCYFGVSPSGSWCVDISTHPLGENHTIFSLIGLNDKCFTSCVPVLTDGNDFI